jgi:hypothetical protein
MWSNGFDEVASHRVRGNASHPSRGRWRQTDTRERAMVERASRIVSSTEVRRAGDA